MRDFKCERCSEMMVDKGRIQEYVDDYSADMPIKDDELYCFHVYLCKNCGNMKNYKINKIDA